MAGTIMLLLMGLLTQFLIPAMRYSAEGQVKVEMQQQAIIAINKMVADLQRTTVGGLSLRTVDPVTMAVVRIDTIDGNGFPSWASEAQVYWYDSGRERLMRETYPPQPPALGTVFLTSKPSTFSSIDLQDIASTDNGAERSLAMNVKRFEVRDADADPGLQALVLELELEKDIPHTDRKAKVVMSRYVYLRNAP